MQREISDRNTLADTLNPIDNAQRSSAIDRTTSNYNDAKEKVQKIRDLINMGKYDPSNIHICFPIKIKKESDSTADIDKDLITVNNFFAHWVKHISITKYGSNKELKDAADFNLTVRIWAYSLSEYLYVLSKSRLTLKHRIYTINQSDEDFLV